jgi:Mg2+ and Co2+ transporter CorA
MNVELIKKFRAGTLTESDLVYQAITDLGSELYPYLRLLQNEKRDVEAGIVEKYRQTLFELRTNLSDNVKSNQEASDVLSKLAGNMHIHNALILVHKVEEHSFLNELVSDVRRTAWHFADAVPRQD